MSFDPFKYIPPQIEPGQTFLSTQSSNLEIPSFPSRIYSAIYSRRELSNWGMQNVKSVLFLNLTHRIKNICLEFIDEMHFLIFKFPDVLRIGWLALQSDRRLVEFWVRESSEELRVLIS